MKDLIKSFDFWRKIFMIILAILILLRPTLSTESSKKQNTNLSIWFVTDATGSMVAKDVNNNSKRRFEQVQSDIKTTLENVAGARYTLLAQDFSSYVAVPMNTNADSVSSALAYVKPKYTYYSEASNLSELLSLTSERIEKYKEKFPNRRNVMIFMSDGEDVSGSELNIPKNLSDKFDSTVVFGYGSTEGSLIEHLGNSILSDEWDVSYINEEDYVTYYGKQENITVDSKRRVISKLDEENLKLIASKLNATYYHRDDDNFPESVLKTFNDLALVSGDPSESDVKTGTEIYWILALILLGLILWDGEEVLKQVLEEREVKNA